MSGSRKIASIAVVCATIVGLGIFLNRKNPSITRPPRAVATGAASAAKGRRVHTHPAPADDEAAGQMDQNVLGMPSREKVEAYVELHHRQAASLLAAFRALNDTNYLYEAATNFPNDPRVQLAVLACNLFPDSRQQWLDAFKASSPSNSLPNYISARENFQNHHPDAALQDLAEASGKLQFQDYAMDTLLDAEDLSRFNGNSAAASGVFAMSQFSQDMLPELANFKGIAISIHDALKQYADAGDRSSVESLAQMGVQTADHLMTGDDGKFVIDQLVGIASETIVLHALDPNTSYPFLGGQTPAQRLAQLQQQKMQIRSVASGVHPAEEDFGEYMDRLKMYGELSAMQWYQQQHPAVKPSTGN